MTNIPSPQTPRLILRGFTADDIEPLTRMHENLDVVEFVNDGRPQTANETWNQLAGFIGHWELRGFGPWAIVERESAALVGYTGIFYPAGWPQPELGWVLRRESWGNGFATEAASCAMAYAFDIIGLDQVASFIVASIERSIRVAKRLGQHRAGTVVVAGSKRDSYVIDRTNN